MLCSFFAYHLSSSQRMCVFSIPTPGFCPKSPPPTAKSENIYFCVSSSSLRDPNICFVLSELSSSRLLSGKESAEKMSIDSREKYIVINFYSLVMFSLLEVYRLFWAKGRYNRDSVADDIALTMMTLQNPRSGLYRSRETMRHYRKRTTVGACAGKFTISETNPFKIWKQNLHAINLSCWSSSIGNMVKHVIGW